MFIFRFPLHCVPPPHLKWKKEECEATPDFGHWTWKGPKCQWAQVSVGAHMELWRASPSVLLGTVLSMSCSLCKIDWPLPKSLTRLTAMPRCAYLQAKYLRRSQLIISLASRKWSWHMEILVIYVSHESLDHI